MDFEEIVIRTERLDFPALAVGVGEPVVCWHGFPDHPATFGALAEYLVAAGRRVIAPFLRGLHPDTADAVTYAGGLTLAADAAAVAEAVASGGVDMIGHDIGAGMVQRVAAGWPERLRRGVTIAVPPPAVIAPMLADSAQLRRFFYIWLFQLDGLPETVLGADRSLVDHLWQTWSPGLTMPERLRELVHGMYGDSRFIRNSLRIYRANFDTGLQDPTLAGLASRTEAPAGTPLLLLAGADDGCIGADMFDGAERGLAPGSRVEILPGAGHFLHLERPQTVAQLALDWWG